LGHGPRETIADKFKGVLAAGMLIPDETLTYADSAMSTLLYI
jgi:hypothetical protein